MASVIEQKVESARASQNPQVIAKMESGWVMMGDTQPLEGYCVLIADPIVPSLNDLSEGARIAYQRDSALVGDALLRVTGAARINYETWCNLDPKLHTHIVPRYRDEPEAKRTLVPREAYDWARGRPFEPTRDAEFIQKMRSALAELSRYKPVTPMVGTDIFVTNEQGKVLLIRRADNGFWGTPGGCQDLGETPKQCAEREFFEETGYRCEATELLGVFSSQCYERKNYPWKNEIVHVLFAAKITGGEARASAETPEMGWFAENELPPLSDGHLERLRFAFAQLRKKSPVHFE